LTFRCRCKCHQELPATKVADTATYGCMIYKMPEHNLYGKPIRCIYSGSFINWHPRSIAAFMDVLAKLKSNRPELFSPQGEILVLNAPQAPQLAVV
jgi:hypothetical protein